MPFCAFDFLPCVLCMVWLGLEQTGVGLQRRDPGDSTLKGDPQGLVEG